MGSKLSRLSPFPSVGHESGIHFGKRAVIKPMQFSARALQDLEELSGGGLVIVQRKTSDRDFPFCLLHVKKRDFHLRE